MKTKNLFLRIVLFVADFHETQLCVNRSQKFSNIACFSLIEEFEDNSGKTKKK